MDWWFDTVAPGNAQKSGIDRLAVEKLINDKTRSITDQLEALTKSQQDLIIEIKRLKPQGWRKMLFFLREWSLLGTNITVVLALLAIIVTLGLRTVTDVREEAAFRTKTDIQIGGGYKTFCVRSVLRE